MKKRLVMYASALIAISALWMVSGRVAFGKYTSVTTKNLPDVTIKAKKYDLSGASIDPISGVFYSGSPHTPGPVVRALGRTLEEGVDYLVSYQNNVYVGTANVVCTGIGSFTGTISTTFEILKKPIERPVVTNREFLYTGAGQGPNVTYDSGWINMSGTLASADNGIHYLTFSLKDSMNTEWSGGGNAAIVESWGIYVCRIGTVLYPTVQQALDTGSSAETPIVLLVNYWAENAENRSEKVNYLDFGGYTWCSRAGGSLLTISSGEVHIVSGTYRGSHKDAVRINGGTFYFDGGLIESDNANGNSVGVHVYGGVAYLGSGQIRGTTAAGPETGFEVYGLQMDGGYADVNGTDIIVAGGNCYAGGIQLTGESEVLVRQVSIQASNTNDAHGTAGIWTDAGLINLYNANVIVNHSGGTVMAGFGMTGTGGTIAVHSGNFTVYGEGNAHGIHAQGASIYAAGGRFEVTVPEIAGITASGVYVNTGYANISGTAEFHVNYGRELCVGAHKAVVSGGSFYVSGGKTYTVGAHSADVSGGTYQVTAYEGMVAGAFECSDTFWTGAKVSGGSFSVYAGGTAEAYGFKDCTLSGGASSSIMPLSLADELEEVDPQESIKLILYGAGLQSVRSQIRGGIYQTIPSGIDYSSGYMAVRTELGYEIVSVGFSLISEEQETLLRERHDFHFQEERLYAGEEALTAPCRLHYSAEGADEVPLDDLFDPGAVMMLSFDEPEKEGYLFNGWNTQSDGSGETYFPGEFLCEIHDLTLYAQWAETDI